MCRSDTSVLQGEEVKFFKNHCGIPGHEPVDAINPRSAHEAERLEELDDRIISVFNPNSKEVNSDF